MRQHLPLKPTAAFASQVNKSGPVTPSRFCEPVFYLLPGL
jgi:hypothetical protein